MFRNGDYTVYVNDNEIKTEFVKSSVARSTATAMKAYGIKIEYDKNKILIQKFTSKTEKQLLKQILDELDNAIKSKYRVQTLSYKILKGGDGNGKK